MNFGRCTQTAHIPKNYFERCNMKKKDDRFIKVYSQGHLSYVEIFVDRETGVNYLYRQEGYSGGLTPLLDKDGKVVVTEIK